MGYMVAGSSISFVISKNIVEISFLLCNMYYQATFFFLKIDSTSMAKSL